LCHLDFLVVQDIFLTETAQLAQVVLPGASFAEKEGTFTNTERRVQLIRRAIPPVGDSKPDWQIVAALATRLGLPLHYDSPSQIMAEIASLTPIYGGIAYDRLGDEGLQWPCPDREHPGTKFLHHGRFAGGLGKFAPVDFIPPAEWPDNHHPFTLITGRHLYHYHTNTMSRRSYGLAVMRPDPYVEMHPAVAARMDVRQGDLVMLTSPRGSIRCKAFITDKIPGNQVFVPFHYPEAAANVLTHTVLDPEAKIPELKGGGVTLSNVPAAAAAPEKEVVTTKKRGAAPPRGQVAAARRRTGGAVRAYATKPGAEPGQDPGGGPASP
jgi:predicted molibdopterin-dependent oxidoreductase YjgC